MRRLLRNGLFGLLWAGALAVAAQAELFAEQLQIVKSGKYSGDVDAYKVDEAFYLDVKDAAGVYGGQVTWFAASNRVELSLRGRRFAFEGDKEKAKGPGGALRLPRPVLLRSSRAFIPVEFFATPEFADAAGMDTKFEPATRLLLVDRRSNVGPLRYFTYPDHTRIVLEISPGLSYASSRRGLTGLEIGIPLGNIEWSEREELKDGVVDFVHLHQETQGTRLSVKLAEPAEWKLDEYDKPRRLVLYVYRKGKAPVGARREESGPQRHEGEPVRPASEAMGAAKPVISPAPAAKPIPPVPPPASAKPPPRRIAIDPGHGGMDSGAMGRRGVKEKDINLLAAMELAALLREEGAFEVLLTRETDVFVPLGDRARIANERGAELFVSLHCNANRSRGESGYEVYFLSERASDPEAERLAEFENSVLALEGKEAVEEGAAGLLYALAKTEFINEAAELSGLVSQTLAKRVDLADRGVKQAAFYVLRGANAPAVLVEMGFVSNPQDEAKLQSRKYRRRIVEGLYAGILDYARRKDWLAGEE